MRKIFASIIILAMAAFSMQAIVAPKTPYQYKQPDGSVVTLVNHGDEFHSWTTMGDVVVQLDADGYWRPAPDQEAAKMETIGSIRRRAEAQQMYMSQKGIGMGNKKFLVVLIEFSDLKFTVSNPKTAFSNLLNQEGYSTNGATGSARDYYMHNSTNKFTPSFDVYGPVTLSKSYTYYGQQVGSTHDAHASEALADACVLLDSQVDFSDYDLDGDGYVDMVFFFFAGHNQAEGASSDTIWPHASNLSSRPYYDGVRVYRYACSSEYRGASGTTMAGIGTFCHEYGHVLGLPDWYDTDYESNGSARDLDNLSLMCSGGYNNNGRTPPRLNAIERNMLDWMDYPTSITASGDYSLQGIQNNKAYILNSSNNGEFFLLEARDGTSWDSPLYPGLYIYHIDKSNNIVTGSYTAKYMWNNNRQKLNCYANHPCFYVLYSQGTSASYGYTPFPGKANITTYNPIAWDGNGIPFTLQNIAYNSTSGKSAFYIKVGSDRTISGTVTDAEGNPIAGASIVMAPYSQQAPGKFGTRDVSKRDASYSAVSGTDGTYEIVLSKTETVSKFNITASAPGYFNKSFTVEFTSLVITCDFALRAIGSTDSYNILKFDPKASFSTLGYSTTPVSIMVSSLFTAKEIAFYAGMKLTSVSFQINATSVKSIHLIVDIGSKRVVTKQITEYDLSKYITVDLTSDNIVIPAASDLRIGYAVSESNEGYPIIFESQDPKSGGLYYSSYSLNSPSWSEYTGNLYIWASVFDPNTETGGGDVELKHLGYSVIGDPGAGSYNAGDNLTLSLDEATSRKPSSVSWYYDDKSVSGGSVTLTSGKHIVKAHLTYADGSIEDLYFAINVN